MVADIRAGKVVQGGSTITQQLVRNLYISNELTVQRTLMEACLAGDKERREPWGVWGGELFVQGVVVARKRPRGRPRKNPVTA